MAYATFFLPVAVAATAVALVDVAALAACCGTAAGVLMLLLLMLLLVVEVAPSGAAPAGERTLTTTWRDVKLMYTTMTTTTTIQKMIIETIRPPLGRRASRILVKQLRADPRDRSIAKKKKWRARLPCFSSSIMAALAVSASGGGAVLAYLDIDIDDSRAASFVESCSIKYGLSSNSIHALGGRERLSVPELYSNDFDWRAKGRCIAQPQPCCRMVFELYPDTSPLAVENFVALCTGSKGKSKGSGLDLCYRGSKLHRYVPNFILQGGDFVFGNGSGGESIFGKKFKDDVNGLKRRHDKRGVLSMGNSGKNSNTSQFFVTLAPAPACDKKHVVFGSLVSGMEVLDLIERSVREATPGPAAAAADEVPPVDLVVTACGVWRPGVDLPQGYWAEDDTFQEVKDVQG